MTVQNKALLLDLVEWVAARPRPYAEVMDAWRTSCPRLTVWEDAVDRGLVRREARRGAGLLVVATSAGHELLKAHRRTCGSAVGRVEGT